MSVFRFNPVFKQWVLLGPALPVNLSVTRAQLLTIGSTRELVAVSHPRHPFGIDAESAPGLKEHTERLYADNPAVGEYEVFLYGGKEDFFHWKTKEWVEWLHLAQYRIAQLHHNPHLHHVSLSLHTTYLDTVEDCQRVGELIATSHPIYGEKPVMTPELADKLRNKEAEYTLHESIHGVLRVPSAPLAEHELWYVPRQHHLGIESIGSGERDDCALVLSKVMAALHEEYPKEQYVLTVYTSLAGQAGDSTWWIRIHKQISKNEAVINRPLPEGFVRTMRLLLRSKRI